MINILPCPKCGWVISFKFDYDKGKYVSICPYCKDRLEMTKEEYEDDSNDKGISFKHDYL